MADEAKSGTLVSAAKTIGSAAGKIAAAAGAKPVAKEKENLFQAEYIGSGTFIIHKPPRRRTKLHQSRVKSPQRGARK